MPTAAKRFRPHSSTGAENRPSSGRRGYGRRWQQHYRIPYLRQNPWCVMCLQQGYHNCGTAESPNHVDHIIPSKGEHDPMHWDWDNLQTLCREHHSEKTVQDQRQGLTR